MKQAAISGGVLLAALLAWPATSAGQEVKQSHSEQSATATHDASESASDSTGVFIAENSRECGASYPDVCIPPSPPDLDCSDVPERGFRVVGDDPHRLDRDKDGIGCEGE